MRDDSIYGLDLQYKLGKNSKSLSPRNNLPQSITSYLAFTQTKTMGVGRAPMSQRCMSDHDQQE